MDCVLSIDQGTQSSRAYLYNAGGKAVGSSQREFAQHFPQRGCGAANSNLAWSESICVVCAIIQLSSRVLCEKCMHSPIIAQRLARHRGH